jgi:nitric oxide reductase NorQ protein
MGTMPPDDRTGVPRPAAPWYREVAGERTVFRAAAAAGLPVLLKGPTGCGKSRLVEAMAAELGRPLVTVACNDDTSAADLLGRWLVQGGDTVWQDGPVTRAVREGAVLYLDEVAEAREDVIVVLHPLADHRRELVLDRHAETLVAPPSFRLVASFNPGYRHGIKELKPSTRQRFVTIGLEYPPAPIEIEIVATEGNCELGVAKRLVALAGKIRALDELALGETVSTRLLVMAARLIGAGLPPRHAAEAAIVGALTDDGPTTTALRELVALAL